MNIMLYILGVALVVFAFLSPKELGATTATDVAAPGIGDLSWSAVYAVYAHGK